MSWKHGKNMSRHCSQATEMDDGACERGREMNMQDYTHWLKVPIIRDAEENYVSYYGVKRCQDGK